MIPVRFFVLLTVIVLQLPLHAQRFPDVNISNGKIHATLALPEAAHGFYRGTRFDWSGAITSLIYEGHSYFGPFFEKIDPSITDVDLGDPVSAGVNSAMSGPVEEFVGSEGYDEAKPGEAFVKIGVGVLAKPQKGNYSSFTRYKLLDGGKWSVRKGADFVEFTQTLLSHSGYAYVYRKTVRLLPGQPEMLIEHSLKDTGQKAIDTSVYDHNFLVMDHHAPGPGLSLTFPFPLNATLPLNGLVKIRDHQIVFLKTLSGDETVYTKLQGFGAAASDYSVRVENQATGTGVTISGDQPLSELAFWCIRTVVAPEPFIHMTIAPGQEYRWTYTYRFFTMKPDR